MAGSSPAMTGEGTSGKGLRPIARGTARAPHNVMPYPPPSCPDSIRASTGAAPPPAGRRAGGGADWITNYYIDIIAHEFFTIC